MTRPLAFCAAAAFLCLASQARAQTATPITIKIHNQSSTITISPQIVPTCNGALSCGSAVGSLSPGQVGTETATTTDVTSGSWFQNYGGYSNNQLYACNFQTSVAFNFAGGCHTVTASASATNGTGPSHPTCTSNKTTQNQSTCAVQVDYYFTQ